MNIQNGLSFDGWLLTGQAAFGMSQGGSERYVYMNMRSGTYASLQHQLAQIPSYTLTYDYSIKSTGDKSGYCTLTTTFDTELLDTIVINDPDEPGPWVTRSPAPFSREASQPFVVFEMACQYLDYPSDITILLDNIVVCAS